MTWLWGSHSREVFRKTDPTLVIMVQQAGDEEVLGDAWLLVKKWRDLRSSHLFTGGGVDWLERETRLRELEIVLIGEHELTLPPETYPWDSLRRKTQVEWRTRTLRRLRKERFRAGVKRRILRLLTLNRWKG